MKPNINKLFVLVLLITFLTISTASPTGAQPPDPTNSQVDVEIPPDPLSIEQAITERSQTTVNGGDNSINAVTSWWSASGTTFVPSSSTMTYNYGGSGCVDTGANFDVWRGSVNLPQGSTITGMWFNYANDVVNPTDTTIYLRRYSFSGTFNDILLVNGINTGIGNHTNYVSTATNNIVDNFIYAYVLVWEGNADQNLCGVNLGYTAPPIFLSALPLITH